MSKKYNWEIQIIEELANKYNLPKRLISSITHSQFHFIAKKATKELKNVKLPFFGKFFTSERKREYWDEYYKLLEQVKNNTEGIQGLNSQEDSKGSCSQEENESL